MSIKTAKKLQKPKAKKLANSKSSSMNIKIPKPSAPYSHGELITALAEYSQHPRTTVKQILEVLGAIIKVHLAKGGPGTFRLLGMIKMLVKTKPARKARKGVSPLTGQEMMFKAKPATKVVRIRPLKKIKEII